MRLTGHSGVTIGSIDVVPVDDGTLEAVADSVLGIAPAETRRLLADERDTSGRDPLVLPVRAFAIRDAGRIMLADTGSGTTKGPTMGRLPQSLNALGVTAAAVDAVVLTHLHMDHIGGLVDDAGRAAFPNAELAMSEPEARYFLDLPKAELDRRSQRHLDHQRAIIAAYEGRIRRIAAGASYAGMTARLSPGHTPGHTVWEIASGGAAVWIIGDVVHLGAVQLPCPEAAMIYDVDPDLAAATRIAVLTAAAERGVIVAGAHLGGDGIGRIDWAGAGFRFSPAAEPRPAAR